MSQDPVMKGIYSSTHKSRIGAGMTSRASVTKRYWALYVEPDGSYTLQPLNQNLVPTGPKRPTTEDELVQKYTFEPDFIIQSGATPIWQAGEDEETTIPATAQDLEPPAQPDPTPIPTPKPTPKATTWDFDDDTPASRVRLDKDMLDDPDADMAAILQRRRDERAIKRREAEDKAEQEARAGFGLGLTHLKRGQRTKAMQLFEKIATMDGEFAPRHKHMFNEFGIGLRKSNLPDLALQMYRRTLELSPNDDHIYHNLARIHYERGETAKAVEMLEKSLELNPALEVSQQFLDYIEKKRKKFPKFSI